MVATECVATRADWMAGTTTWGRMMRRFRNREGSKRGGEIRHPAGGQLYFILDGSHGWALPHTKIMPKYGCFLIFLQIYLATVVVFGLGVAVGNSAQAQLYTSRQQPF